PTALVNEAYLKLIDQKVARWENRAHFFGIASQLMRRILVDHARKSQAAKRGGGLRPAELDDNLGVEIETDWVKLDDALKELALLDPRQAKVVELRYFGGLAIEEVSKVLEISPATVKREWTLARAYLLKALREES